MRKSAVFVVLIAMASLVTVSAAEARAAKWEPLPSDSYEGTYCGGTTVIHGEDTSHEYVVRTFLPDGTRKSVVRGSLKTTLTTDAGKSVSINASGPATYFRHPD